MEREKLFLSVEIIMLTIVLYFHGISQNMEYWSYKLAKNDFELIEADMVGSNEEIYGSERKPNFTYDTQQIVYYIDGRIYNKRVYSYPERTKGESFLIAVRKDNPYLIKRCTPYKLTIKDIKTIILYGSVILIFLLYKIFSAFYKRRKSNNNYIEKQNDNQLQVVKKQKIILSFCNNEMMTNSKEINFSQIECRLGITLTESFKWCLLNLSQVVIDLHMPFLKKTKNNLFLNQKLCILESWDCPINIF